jgi:hypothetical protein
VPVLASLVEIHLCDALNDRRTLGIAGIGEERNVPDVCGYALMWELT